jgi:protein-tyrosine-phosphatase
LARYPSVNNRLVYLSQFESSGELKEIEDPDGRDINTFLDTYKKIDQCLLGMVQLLKNHAESTKTTPC